MPNAVGTITVNSNPETSGIEIFLDDGLGTIHSQVTIITENDSTTQRGVTETSGASTVYLRKHSSVNFNRPHMYFTIGTNTSVNFDQEDWADTWAMDGTHPAKLVISDSTGDNVIVNIRFLGATGSPSGTTVGGSFNNRVRKVSNSPLLYEIDADPSTATKVNGNHHPGELLYTIYQALLDAKNNHGFSGNIFPANSSGNIPSPLNLSSVVCLALTSPTTSDRGPDHGGLSFGLERNSGNWTTSGAQNENFGRTIYGTTGMFGPNEETGVTLENHYDIGYVARTETVAISPEPDQLALTTNELAVYIKKLIEALPIKLTARINTDGTVDIENDQPGPHGDQPITEQNDNNDDFDVDGMEGGASSLTVTPETVTLSEIAAATAVTASLNFLPGAGETTTVTVTGVDTSEFVVAPISHDYDGDNNEQSKEFTITPVQDFIADGDQGPITITFTTSGHTDQDNNNLTDTVEVTITDSAQVADFTVSPSGPITLNEGDTQNFSVVLTAQPTDTVIIDYEIIDLDARASVSLSTNNDQKLTFNSGNWNTPQTITLTIADDEIDESGNVSGQIKFSLDDAGTAAAEFNNANANNALDETVDITIAEDVNDVAGVTVSNIPISLEEGHATNNQKSLSMVLDTEPINDVTVTLNFSAEITSAITNSRLTVDATSLIFTPANYSTPQNITFTAVDDNIAYSNISNSTIGFTASSLDAAYNAIPIANTTLSLVDNDSFGVVITAGPNMVGNEITIEEGETSTFTVELSSQPLDTVTITFDENNILTQAISDNRISLNPAPANNSIVLTFETNNWNTPQTITVQGVDNNIDDLGIDGMQLDPTVSSNDTSYNNLAVPSIDIELLEDTTDSAGVTIGNTPINLEEGHVTNNQKSLSMVLNSEPTDDVTVTLNLAQDILDAITAGRLTISSTSLTFTAANYSTSQNITFTAIDDDIVYNNIVGSSINFTAASNDATYDQIQIGGTTLSLTDNDSVGVVITAGANMVGTQITIEEGETSNFTVELNSQPLNDVTVTFSENNILTQAISDNRISLDPAPVGNSIALTFEAGTWDTPQTITVQGVDNNIDDLGIAGMQLDTAVTSNDALYNNLAAPSIQIELLEDNSDVAGVTIGAAAISLEEGHATNNQKSLSVVLDTEPTDDVTINLTLHADITAAIAAGRLTVSTTSLTFTPANHSTPQNIIFTAIDDNIAYSNIVAKDIDFAAVSNDANYNQIQIASTTLSLTDNDTFGATITPGPNMVGNNITINEGETSTFTVELNSEPLDTVTITLNVDTALIPILGNPPPAGRVNITPAPDGSNNISLTFTPSGATAWNVPQTITIEAIDNSIIDGDVTNEPISFTVTSNDGNYNNLSISDVQVTVRDNDNANIDFSKNLIIVSETGWEDSLIVTLSSQPTHNVDFVLGSLDNTEFNVNNSTFSITPNNWNTGHEIVFTGVPDDIADGTTTTFVTVTVSSNDANFNLGLLASQIEVRNLDNVPAGGFPEPCQLISENYTINYYTCALSQYKYRLSLPYRLGGSKVVANIRHQDPGNYYKTFIGDQKT